MNLDTRPDRSDWDAVAARLRGSLVRPGDAAYDEARAVWNARIDRHPAAIVRCAGVEDVVVALGAAREWKLPLAVRGGGHDYAGLSTCEGGIVVDLAALHEVTVDPAAMTVRAQAGARWSAVDGATQAHGLATTGGTVSSVGVAGYTLGGGMGHLSRLHGLAVDNLLSADLVTAGGEAVRASAVENPDLFWAIRGGGGNFGVATAFEYRLHRVGPEVLTGQIVYPFSAATKVLEAYRRFAAEAPDELTCYAFIFNIPPVPPFPERYHGQVGIDLVVVHVGEIAEGLRLIEPLRTLGEPVLDAVGPQPYATVQQTFDAGMPKGLRWYSRAHHLDRLSDEVITTVVEHARQLPGLFTMAYFGPLGGAIGRVDPGATAFPDRSAAFAFHILSGWADSAADERNIAWTRTFHQALRPHAKGAVYVNLLSEDEDARIPTAYGANYDRLAAAKRRWDPGNLFRLNHNVPPSA
jgi:FAD/FMN-containing dehydrogenase